MRKAIMMIGMNMTTTTTRAGRREARRAAMIGLTTGMGLTTRRKSTTPAIGGRVGTMNGIMIGGRADLGIGGRVGTRVFPPHPLAMRSG